jgi:hypothetical protein
MERWHSFQKIAQNRGKRHAITAEGSGSAARDSRQISGSNQWLD